MAPSAAPAIMRSTVLIVLELIPWLKQDSFYLLLDKSSSPLPKKLLSAKGLPRFHGRKKIYIPWCSLGFIDKESTVKGHFCLSSLIHVKNKTPSPPQYFMLLSLKIFFQNETYFHIRN